jgi:uncharacterized damage-inducible protein DinB
MSLWINRNFEFVLPVELFPNVLERLRGTPSRLEEKLSGVPREILTRRPDGKWSVQEQVGHLGDVEELWRGRLDDYEAGLTELRPADITNRVTSHKDHNADDLARLLLVFRGERAQLTAGFERFGVERAGLVAHHPRLNRPMRVIDLGHFIAEHDDHHLASIHRLLPRV